MRFKNILTAMAIVFSLVSNAGAVPFRKIVLEDMSIGSGTYTSPSGKVTGKTKINAGSFPFKTSGFTGFSSNDLVDGGFDLTIKPGTLISGGPEISILKYDADNDGGISGSEFAAMVAGIGSTQTTLLVDVISTVSATVALPSTLSVRFVSPGKLTINTGVTLTINGPFISPLYQSIQLNGSASLLFSNTNSRIVFPQWWGAKVDGTTDDTAAIQSALDSLSTIGGTLRLTSGTYFLNSAVIAIPNFTKFVGAGRDATILKLGSGLSDYAVELDGGGNSRTKFCYLADFTIDGDDQSAPLGGIRLDNVNEQVIERVRVHSFTNGSANGVLIEGTCWNFSLRSVRVQLGSSSATGPVGSAGFKIAGDNHNNIKFDTCVAHLCKTGFHVSDMDNESFGFHFDNCMVQNVDEALRSNTGVYGIYIGERIVSWSIRNCVFDRWNKGAEIAIKVSGAKAGVIESNGFYDCIEVIDIDETATPTTSRDIDIRHNRITGPDTGIRFLTVDSAEEIFFGPNSLNLSKVTNDNIYTNSAKVLGYREKTITVFTDGDTTPSINGNTVFKTTNTSTTTITAFDDGVPGREVVVIIGDTNTTIDFTGTDLKGNVGVDWSPVTTDHMSLTCGLNGLVWYIDVSDNTP